MARCLPVLPPGGCPAAGGWKTNQIVRDLYQQADASTILKAVLHAGELWEVQ